MTWMFYNISIRNKIFLINGLIILFLCGLLGYLILLLKDIDQIIERQNVSLQKLELSQTATRHFQFMKYWMSDLSVSWLNQSEENADASYAQLKDVLARLDLGSENALPELLGKLEGFYQLGIDALDAYVDENPVQGNVFTSRGRELAREIEAPLDRLIAQNRKAAELAGLQVSDSNRHMTTTTYVLMLIVILVTALLSRLLATMVVRPLNAANKALAEMSTGAGDLTRRLEIEGNDEITEFSESFNSFVGKIQQIVKSTVYSAEQLALSAQTLSEIVKDNEKFVADQQSETEQMAAAIHKVGTTSNTVAENASKTAQSTQSAQVEVASGNAVVEKTIQSMRLLEEQVNSSTRSITDLAKHTEDISGLLEDIRNIADQTNLLALNAAIEAARAGEQGRGFAVVADEVRLLAQRTQNVTDNIQELIGQLQTKTRNSVSTMEKGLKQTGQTVSLAKQAGESLTSISTVVATITHMSNEIATAAEQQSASTAEVDRSIDMLFKHANDSLGCAERTAQTGQKIRYLSKVLNESVGKFKV